MMKIKLYELIVYFKFYTCLFVFNYFVKESNKKNHKSYQSVILKKALSPKISFFIIENLKKIMKLLINTLFTSI